MTSDRLFNLRVASGNRELVSVNNYPVFEQGVTFLFGESGIGKSLISKVLYGYNPSPDLDISVNGKSYAEHRRGEWSVAVRENSFFVFQEPSSHLNPLATIEEQLSEGSLAGNDHRSILSSLWSSSPDGRIEKLLSVFPKAHRPSGGEKQRILLAMAFKRIDAWLQTPGTAPTCFVFDEPTGSLDNSYRNLFLSLLFERFVTKPFTTVIITHDYSIITEVYKRYRSLVDRIRFCELSRIADSEVAVTDFSAEAYLSWLKTTGVTISVTNSIEPVLKVAPQFSIFGRTCTIYRDSAHSTQSALTINKGEMVYLKAPSGIGKTTLAKIIMGIYHPSKVQMLLAGHKINEKTPASFWHSVVWGKRAGMVFQHADEALNLASTVRESFKGLPDASLRADTAIESCLLELFDRSTIPAIIDRQVAHLSGGQKQRLNLLRTLILDTDLVILDEPLNGLDFLSVKRVLALLNRKRAQGSALLMISHNEEIFEHCVGREHIYYLGSTD